MVTPRKKQMLAEHVLINSAAGTRLADLIRASVRHCCR